MTRSAAASIPAEMVESTALVVADVPAAAQFALARPPAVVLEEARNAARALKDVLDAKAKKVVFNGEQYLEFEDWQTLGRFYGVTAKVVDTHFVEYGDVKGFAARAVALRADGAEISAAEAECLNDEPKWRSRPVYEWGETPTGRRERLKVGEEPVPLFMLKSMAQTRASAKALRNVLAWVVVLAGYRPTPAEELPPERDAGAAPVRSTKRSRPTGSSQSGAAAAADDAPPVAGNPSVSRATDLATISVAQQKKLFAVATAAGWNTDDLRALLARHHITQSRDILAAQYDAFLIEVQAGPARDEQVF